MSTLPVAFFGSSGKNSTSRGMMLGYYQMPEKTADVIRDGWYFTHDVGYLDEDGYQRIR